MTNKEKYDNVFISSFSLQPSALSNNIEYNTIPEWDSIGHMTMIAGIEETFGITMESDDIISFSSYKKGQELLAKYGIKFE